MAESGSESIKVNASASRILDVVADIESYPDWMPAFKQAKVLDAADGARPARAEFEVDARLKVINYTLEYSWTDTSVSWNKVAGDVKEIKGSYDLSPDGDGTEVKYTYTIDPGFPVPGFLMKQGVKMMVSGALNDLKKRSESA